MRTATSGSIRALSIGAVIALLAVLVVFTADDAGAQTVVICDGQEATIVGTPGNDTLIGTTGDDVIAALQGDDIVKGAGGDDIICGGIGNDQLFGGDGFDVMFGAQGDDLLVSAKTKTGADTAGSRMFGGAGNDVVYGSTGWDRMQGGIGNDELYGGASRDWIRGGLGNDVIDGGAWIDDINAGYGNDRIVIDGPDLIKGGPGLRDECTFGTNSAKADVRGCEFVFGEPPVDDMPDAGSLGTAVMGRANWRSGYVQAAILRDLLVEVGYNVTEPASKEFSPDLGYSEMAVGGEAGGIDFWANSWYPGHLAWWEGELPNGTAISDNLTRVEGSLLPGGGLQGMLITKSWAEENGITTMDQINDNEAFWSQLDTDGNGKGEFFGCPEEWTCDDIMNSQIAFAGWDNLEQISVGYDAMFAEFLPKAQAGEPAIMYIWAPTSYLAQAIPGETTMWLSVNNDSVLDDSNPLGIEGGEEYCQQCIPGEIGYQGLGADVCLQGPDGCQLGWEAADIEITANTEWLAENPVAAEMFNQFKPPLIDIAIAGIELDASNGSTDAVNRIAADWIEANRALADSWVAAAAAAR